MLKCMIVYWHTTAYCTLYVMVSCIIRGANLDSTCRGMCRPLHRAGGGGDASVVEELLAMGAAPNEVDVNK